MVYFVLWFKNGTGKELGDCNCGAQTPESGDVDGCMYVVVDTEYHHHVLSDAGLWLCLWLWFKVFGWVNKVKIILIFFKGKKNIRQFFLQEIRLFF